MEENNLRTQHQQRIKDLHNFFLSEPRIMTDRNIQFKANLVGMWLDMDISVVVEQISNLLQLKNFQKVKVQLSRQGLKLTKKGFLPGLTSEDLIALHNIQDIFVNVNVPSCFICITSGGSSSPTQIMALKCLNEICAKGIVTHFKILTGDKKSLVQSLRNAQLASLGASQNSNHSTNSDSSEGNNDLSDSVGSNTESGYTTDHELCEKETDSDSKPEFDLVLSGLSLKESTARNRKQDIKILIRNVSNLKYLLQKHAGTINRQEFLDANKKIQQLNEEIKQKTRSKVKNSESDSSKSKKGNTSTTSDDGNNNKDGNTSSSSSGIGSGISSGVSSGNSSGNSDDNSDSHTSNNPIFSQKSKRKNIQSSKNVKVLSSIEETVMRSRSSSNSSIDSLQEIGRQNERVQGIMREKSNINIISKNEDTTATESEFLTESSDDVFFTNQLSQTLRRTVVPSSSPSPVPSHNSQMSKTRKKSNMKRDSERVLTPGRQVRFSESTETLTMSPPTPRSSEYSFSETMEIPVRRHFFYQKPYYPQNWTPVPRNDYVRITNLKTHVLKPIERVYSTTNYSTTNSNYRTNYFPQNEYYPGQNPQNMWDTGNYQYEPSYMEGY